ncbi:MAG: nucleotidyltransferase family protein [Streptosporangiaceae bacterium]
MSRAAGLLLAAGEGARLGSPKALVELGGERLVDRGVRILHVAGCVPVHVVLGAAVVDLPQAEVVHNPEWRTGMGSSLRAGFAALPADADAVVVTLVDQPLIGAESVRRLVVAYEGGARLAVATYDGARRNPVLFGRELWGPVGEAARGDVGARPYLRAHPELVTPVECGDIADPADIDSPADLAALRR